MTPVLDNSHYQKNTYYEDFGAFCEAIDLEITKVNITLRKDLKFLFSLNFQIVDTTKRDGIL